MKTHSYIYSSTCNSLSIHSLTFIYILLCLNPTQRPSITTLRYLQLCFIFLFLLFKAPNQHLYRTSAYVCWCSHLQFTWNSPFAPNRLSATKHQKIHTQQCIHTPKGVVGKYLCVYIFYIFFSCIIVWIVWVVYTYTCKYPTLFIYGQLQKEFQNFKLFTQYL